MKRNIYVYLLAQISRRVSKVEMKMFKNKYWIEINLRWFFQRIWCPGMKKFNEMIPWILENLPCLARNIIIIFNLIKLQTHEAILKKINSYFLNKMKLFFQDKSCVHDKFKISFQARFNSVLDPFPTRYFYLWQLYLILLLLQLKV